MLDFRSIETFLWVVKLGSFRGAAQQLNTTQPAISQRIAQLEREMGVKLLNRDHRWCSPTPSGRQMMVYAEKLIGLRAEMMAEVGDRSAMRGVLRLGVAETIVHTWLPRLVKSVNDVYPNLSLEIEVDITPNLRARLLAQEIELAFVVGPLSAPSVRNRVLCDYPIGFLASPSLGLGNGPVTRARSREVSDHHLSAQDPALRDRALAVQPARPAADPAARQRFARDRHPHGDRRARDRRDSRPRSSRTNWPTAGCSCSTTDLKIAPLTFTASWLASPDVVAVERVADLAAEIAQSSLVG